MLLKLENIEVKVENKVLLQNFNLELNKSEAFVIFGPNGSGKSSLLLALMSYPKYAITSGSVIFNGREITSLPIAEKAKLGFGLGFQYPPEVAGLKYIDLLKLCEGAKELSAYAKKMIKTLNLQDFLNRDVNVNFSGGERKRAEILQLLLMKPKILLLDEPDSGVDIESLALIGRVINDYLQTNKASAIIVTHNGFVLDFINARHGCVLMQKQAYCHSDPKKVFQDIKHQGYSGCLKCKERKK